MASRDINYLAKKYCGQCFELLDDDFDGTCGACGQKTAALNINKRLKFDSAIDERDRNVPKKAAMTFGAACLIHLVYSVVLLLMLTGLVAKPEVSSGSSGINSDVTVTTDSDAYYINKAMDCGSLDEFLSACEPLSHDREYYSWIWTIAQIRSKNVGNEIQDPLPVTEKTSGSSVISRVGSPAVAAAYILGSLIGLWLCVSTFLDKDGSTKMLALYSEIICLPVAFTLNFFSVALIFVTLQYLYGLQVRLGGEKMTISRIWKIHKAKKPIGNADEWCCKNCGYINSRLDSECKSCGKYK
ncbi:MAG: hypothetical protein K2N38_00215 [Oscillospiraceae bacterium]|nr:hypothetical protein [Oscillospiraceae bacterium]